MNVPGFNASASLYRSPVSYLIGSQANLSPGRPIQCKQRCRRFMSMGCFIAMATLPAAELCAQAVESERWRRWTRTGLPAAVWPMS